MTARRTATTAAQPQPSSERAGREDGSLTRDPRRRDAAPPPASERCERRELRTARSHPVRQRDAEEAGQGAEAALEDQGGGEADAAEGVVALLQDRVAVVEGVELLGQLQGVAGERATAPGSRRPWRPGRRCGRCRGRGPRGRRSRRRRRGRARRPAPGRRRDPPRAGGAGCCAPAPRSTAGTGPDSPSKLSASSKSKAITRVVVALTIRKRRAATAISRDSPSRAAESRSRLRLAISSRALASSWSRRSSALTPIPLRPDISRVALVAGAAAALDLAACFASVTPGCGVEVAEEARRRRRQRHHFVGEVDRALGLLAVAQGLEAGADDLLQVALAGVDDVDDPGGAAEGGVVDGGVRPLAARSPTPPPRPSAGSGSRVPGARTSTAGRRCPCRRR